MENQNLSENDGDLNAAPSQVENLVSIDSDELNQLRKLKDHYKNIMQQEVDVRNSGYDGNSLKSVPVELSFAERFFDREEQHNEELFMLWEKMAGKLDQIIPLEDDVKENKDVSSANGFTGRLLMYQDLRSNLIDKFRFLLRNLERII